MTTVYLIRHSVRMPLNEIESYRLDDSKDTLNEKIILSVEGERRAKLLSEKEELKNIDIVYTSSYVRTLQTAKYLMESQNLKANIDSRLNERRVRIKNDKSEPNWFEKQYLDENYKTIGGESQKEVRKRFDEAFEEIINQNKNKRIAIFSHGYAITFFLLKYCKLKNIEGEHLTLEFNNKIIFDKKINAPEVFKLTINDNKIINIELIEFDDIKYNRGV